MFSGDVPDFSAGTHAVLNKDCELGRGGFGAVYKTLLRDGRPVAIKKLTVSSLVKSQSDFEVEVKKLGKLRHPNIVTMEGYYWTPSLQLLIYEFAKIGDCGLAKLLPMLDRYVLSSKIQSALGYMAPEFACPTVKVNEKCDVYGSGAGAGGGHWEEAGGVQEDDVVVLCDLVRAALEEGRVEESVDPRLMGTSPLTRPCRSSNSVDLHLTGTLQQARHGRRRHHPGAH
ncbi:unnamed protein product [Spirodela intermedia]|uniref:Protein kinase domain-containing protein n=1 Tax=Spirodela intermedia TaxID=51605 RepID=A0A7I8IHH4_SPIIN|nr:unnamed protein product [Spirodela intermedia]CAA6656957.1 unnamed protein product [Spirodela intermedia]